MITIHTDPETGPVEKDVVTAPADIALEVKKTTDTANTIDAVNAELYEPASTKDTIQLLYPFIQEQKGLFLWSCANSLVNKIFDMAPPIVVGWAVDTISGTPPKFISDMTGEKDFSGTALILALLVVIIHVLESVCEYFAEIGFLTLAQNIQHRLRVRVYAHIQSLELEFFETHRLGDTLSRLNNDINEIETFCSSGFNELLQLFILVVFSLFLLYSMDVKLAAIATLPIPLVIMASIFYHRVVEPRYKSVRKLLGALNSRLENAISGILVIKSFTAEEFEANRVKNISHQYRTANIHAVKVIAVYVPLIRMFIALSFAGVVFLGGYEIMKHLDDPTDPDFVNVISLGQFVTFTMLTQRVLWPMTRLGRTLDRFERSNTSAQRTVQILNRVPQVRDKPNPVAMQNIQGTIEWKDVVFAYKNRLAQDNTKLLDKKDTSGYVLNKFNLLIKKHEFVGVVGVTGAGKSTLIKTLMRLYDVQQGKVTVDGVDIRDMSLQTLRSNISLVSQDVYLFHGTIGENLLYGIPTAEHKSKHGSVVKACTMAQLHDFIMTLPDKYDTLVGERGIKLSGGQRQRLSIARALLKNAPIIIMDESTSSVDSETERAIQENLATFIQGKTALVIAHRLSTICRADRIVVLKAGVAVETGTHAELVALQGVYADLWGVQSGGAT